MSANQVLNKLPCVNKVDFTQLDGPLGSSTGFTKVSRILKHGCEMYV